MNNPKSAASLGLEAIANELSRDDERPFVPVDLDEAQRERELGMKPQPDPVASYAPPLPLPDYVKHSDDAPRSGMLSAQAIVTEFENTAKEIERLGEELKAAEAHAAERQATFAKALADLTTTAAAYREEAKRVFTHVEEVTAMASSATALAAELRAKIANGNGH